MFAKIMFAIICPNNDPLGFWNIERAQLPLTDKMQTKCNSIW